MSKQESIGDNVFSFTQHKNEKVIIFWKGQQVRILKDKNALKFLNRTNGADEITAQLIMAKLTGNFKRGNERKKKTYFNHVINHFSIFYSEKLIYNF